MQKYDFMRNTKILSRDRGPDRKNGIIIKVIDKVDNEIKVELVVPSLGRYEILLESPDTTGVLFIKQIIFYPN